ncbi:MAG: hypothetical protein C5B59_10535 [Bacteroidetes bacterium]|nr:MAG: hypothetical protein C5B59_10535 [Bacteroidota bacterium]
MPLPSSKLEKLNKSAFPKLRAYTFDPSLSLTVEKQSEDDGIKLTGKEKEFIINACSELTYKEIAAKMDVSPRTVDTYRDYCFEKLQVKSRVGLVLYAIRKGLVKV